MLALVPDYLHWHYRYGKKDTRIFFVNIIWFLWHFFSIGLLLRTLLVPWQRLDEHGRKGNLQSYFEAFILTTLMRLVGAGMRLVFISFGLIAISCTFLIGIFISLVWIILPAVLIIGVLLSMFLIFSLI